MRYRTYQPTSLLSRYIRSYWSLESTNSTAHKRERIFPDGCIELVFNYGDVFRKHFTDFESHRQPRSFVHGQLKRYMEVEPTGAIGIFSIRFEPFGLKAFADVDISQLSDDAILPQDIWKIDGRVLEDKMLDAVSDQQRILIIESFLTARLRPLDKSIQHAVHSIMSSAGTKSIKELCSEVNLGRRQLERAFLGNVGLSPKLLARIVRFQNTLQRIERKSFLTGIAHSNGYCDQSHFIRDFKEFSGLNPKQYFKSDLELAKYLVSL
jgi:AraC-like DNA-binding protein